MAEIAHRPNLQPPIRRDAVDARRVCALAYLFNCRYPLAPVRGWQDFTGNPYVLLSIAVLFVIQMAFTYLPFMQKLFGVVALDAAAWSLIAGFGVLLFAALEVEKLAIRKLGERNGIGRSG